MSAITSIDAKTITAHERMQLLIAINGTRSGLFRFYVAFEYKKQTKSPPRIAGVDFLQLPGCPTNVHLGWLVAAPTNKNGKIYLRLADVARADGQNYTAWTSVIPTGLTSFQIRGIAPSTAPLPAQPS